MCPEGPVSLPSLPIGHSQYWTPVDQSGGPWNHSGIPYKWHAFPVSTRGHSKNASHQQYQSQSDRGETLQWISLPSTGTSPATHEERRQPSHSLRGMICFFFFFIIRGPPQMIPHQETLFHINETHSSQNFHESTSLNTLGCPDSGSNQSSESAALDSLALGWVVCLMDSHPNVGEPIWASLMMPPPPRCLLFALESSQ